jgi:hypothetical protein
VLDTPKCGDRLDHAVLVVGYGYSAEAVPYWKVLLRYDEPCAVLRCDEAWAALSPARASNRQRVGGGGVTAAHCMQ